MKSAVRVALFVSLMVLASAPLWARRDPLTETEVNQLRDTAQEPDKRLLLYVKFIRARMESLDQSRTDPRFTDGRQQQIHDLLEDIDVLVQEMDDNIDDYAKRRYDIRKPLKNVVDLDTELQAKLQAMKQGAGTGPQQMRDMKDYAFPLDNALESVGSSLSTARDIAQEQEAAVKAAKEQKKK
jgi:hypothetical protein